MNVTPEDIWHRLKRMNDNFGRGDLQRMEFLHIASPIPPPYIPCRGVVTRVPYQCAPEERIFRVDETGTLYYAGHQSKLTRPFVIR